MKEFEYPIPRRAVDQQKSSKRVKEKSVQKGDLIFFNSGSGISHVGIVVSEKGEPLKMIHASSSKGVIITDLESSSYWKNRLDSFGTYFD
jgi:cell wall-associated NlpC family hydrolase